MSQRKRLSAIMGAPVQADPAKGDGPARSNPVVSSTSPPVAGATPPSPPPEKRSGAARSLAALWHAQPGISDAGDGAVIEIDPALCDPSAVADRVPDATDAGFAAFVEQIRQEGQHTPILVRRHPAVAGRYEIAYGRRRTRAAREIGRPVRAILRDLSDAELVIAQGSENLAREDLSYIERAHFARNLDRAGIARDVILKAMGVHRPDLSNYLSIAESIPDPVIARIGPAPKIGRPRWLTLAERLRATRPEQVERILASVDLASRDSDARFALVLSAFSAAPKARPKPRAETLKDAKGLKYARVERTATALRVTVEEGAEPGFGDYLAERIPEILAAYRASKG